MRISQFRVIIQALAPVIGPYMSRAITMIHIQETVGSRTSSTTAGARSHCNADSRMVGGRSEGAGTVIDADNAVEAAAAMRRR